MIQNKLLQDAIDAERYGTEYALRQIRGDKTMNHTESSNAVDHPSHYQGKTEVIDIIEQAVQGLSAPAAFSRGNAVKYLMRAGKKGDVVTDLEKAIWYIKREIELEGE